MWTCYAGTFLRELALWGDLEDACRLADCLINLVRPNPAGFFSFPNISSLVSRIWAAKWMAPAPS